MAPKDTHTTSTADAETRVNGGAKGRALATHTAALSPRLLDLQAAADYLSLSTWTVRTLEAAGLLPRIHIPMPPEDQRRGRNGDGSGELRKLLFDRVDLDQCIEKWKDTHA